MVDPQQDAVPGAPTPEPAGSGSITHVRSSTVNVFRAMLEDEHGAGAWREALDRLSPESRRELDHDIGSYAWVPVAAVLEMEASLPRSSRAADCALRGATTADQHLNVAHRWLLSFISVETILRQSSLLFRFYYKGGRAWLEAFEGREARIAFHAEGMYPGWYTHTLPGYLKRILEIGGARDVELRHEPPGPGSTDPVHRFHVAWRD